MQRHFAQALLDGSAPGPALRSNAGGRFNVYRNTYRITLRNALRTTFPAVERLVGVEYFAALAAAFAEHHPPRSPIMACYGDAFPDFVEQFAPLAGFPYLADVARVEYARVQAYHAADAVGFDLAGEAAAMIALDHPVRLHPSVSIIASAHPVHSIWQAQVREDDLAQPDWRAETALVWRHAASETVETMPIDAEDVALLGRLANGASLATWLADCPDQQAATFLITRFCELATAGILVPSPPIDHGATS